MLKELRGSDVIIECLLEQGVDTVFGYPGGAVLNIYDSLYKYSDKIHMLDLKEGVWYEAGKMPLGMETNGILVGHTVFLFGGYRQRTLSDILTYDLITGLWRKRGKLWR